ncbi:hypothetical protein C8F04DRAFT_1268582 [Mycena alexandri]|uniref:Uncharacterized protein n=1 Tax=Mycena alexandri TaxID=1745969 RepID=A0AAD6WYU1_9AGAR|nr:hypothetical protein C8F04DRAFT_1268582 [Mycena alexandri]
MLQASTSAAAAGSGVQSIPTPVDDAYLSDLSDLSDSDTEDEMAPTGNNLLQGDFFRRDCDTEELLAFYIKDRDPDRRGDPVEDLKDFHASHILDAFAPRRSARIRHLLNKNQEPPSTAGEGERKRKRKRNEDVAPQGKVPIPRFKVPRVGDTRNGPWINREGGLKAPDHDWSTLSVPWKEPDPSSARVAGPSSQPIAGPSWSPIVPPPPLPLTPQQKKNKRRGKGAQQGHRGGQLTKHKDGSNPGWDNALEHRVFATSDVVKSPTFSLLHDASVSPRGWQGRPPPKPVREEIRHLYLKKPDAEALYPWLQTFTPIHYKMPNGPHDPTRERGTFLVDRKGIIFLYRSYRAQWAAARIDEIEEAQKVLVGNDLEDASIQASFETGLRGKHMAIIFGHARQSQETPQLVLWGRQNSDRVERFRNLKIFKDILGWVCSIFRTIWPALAARFKADADWHREHHGIEPMFDLFWNFCWNASFPDQRRTHAYPHVDGKNQLSCCFIFTFVLKSGAKFNHKVRTWLALWEADAILELPPWTLTGYPSALFYHFNIDVHKLQTVWTEVDVERPTQENSHPVAQAGDETGRGSMVFFSQSSMRVGPITGYDTQKMADEAGFDVHLDPNLSLKEAFERSAFQMPLPAHVVERFSAYES